MKENTIKAALAAALGALCAYGVQLLVPVLVLVVVMLLDYASYMKDSVKVEEYRFKGNREKIREQATVQALDLLRRSILKNYKKD